MSLAKKMFIRRFFGVPDLAGRRITKFIRSQRDPSGWKRVGLERATGGKEQIFIAADRSPDEIRRDRCPRKLAALINAEEPSMQPYKSKMDSKVSYQWQLLAKLSEDCTTRLGKTLLRKTGIDATSITVEYNKFLATLTKQRL